MLQLANPQIEYKEAAVMSYGVEHQGRTFRACKGLMYWIRYDEYVFDIRDVRRYLNLPITQPKLDIIISVNTFRKKITQILEAIGDENFIMFCGEVALWLLEQSCCPAQKAEKREVNNENELPF